MKVKVLFLALVVLGLAAPVASAQQTSCIDFDNFCDGMEINVGGGLSGTWQNTDCAGTDVPFDRVGLVGPGQARMVCISGGCPLGIDFLFAVDFPAGTFDLFGFDGINPPFPVQINSPFTLLSGACPFAPGDGGGIPSTLR